MHRDHRHFARQENAMNRQYHAQTLGQRPTAPKPVAATSSAMLGTSLLITRSPRHNRALAGLLRAPSGRVT
jgi:hypothetical protein